MRRTICFLVGILILGLGNGCTKAKEDIRFIGYYVSGSALALTEDAAEGLTHLHLAFLYPEEDGSLIGTDLFRTHCLQAARIQEENKELKILASVGGWGYSEAFEEIAKNPQSRRRFIEEILGWVEKYDLDGVDMDWEYPDGEQKGDFWQLITELRNALNLLEESEGREYLLSLAVPAFSSFPGEILMGEAVGDIDYWNLMTYDYHLGREGANAPLYDLQDECVARTVRAYEKTGIQKEALNLGIPLYGRGWDAQTGWIQASYDEIQKEYAGFQYTYHPITKTPYRLWGDNWISYDDEESVGAKARYARKKGLGGLMFWELSDDREKVLLNAARQAWQED